MKKTLWLALILLLVCTFVFSGCEIDEPDRSTNALITEATTAKNTAQTTTATTKDNSTETVYYTATGTKYHSRKSCSGLSNAKNIYSTDLQSAKNKGLGPCSKCH